jgi:hypothetical protein
MKLTPLVIVGVLMVLFQYQNVRGKELNQIDENQLGAWMAPDILHSVSGKQDRNSVATRTYAFILLRMPSHASESLRNGKETLQPLEAAILKGDIARLSSDENVEYAGFLKTYLPLIHSTNLLLAAHLENLRTIAGSGIVTNLPPDTKLDPSFVPLTPGKVTMVVTISMKWLATASSTGSYRQLANQLRLINGLRHQPRWDVLVVISQEPEEEAMSMQIFDDNAADYKNTPAIIASTDPLFVGNDKDSERAWEDDVLKAELSLTE